MTMETGSAIARAAVDILRAGDTVLTPATMTSIRALLESAQRTEEEDDILGLILSLQAKLAATLEPSDAIAGVSLDMLEASAAILTPFLMPANITDIGAKLGAAQGTEQG
jgi:hypothetical protein